MFATSLPWLHDQWLIFELGDQSYGLPISAVREIVPMAELSRPAGAPTCLSGVLALGREAIAVVALRGLFGLPERPWDLHTPLILLKSSAPALAIVVDRVTQVATIGANACREVPAGCSINECAVAALRVEEITTVLLAPDRLLLAAENSRLCGLMEHEQRRVAETSEVES